MKIDPQATPDAFFDAVSSEYDPLSGFEVDDEDIDESDGQQGPNTEVQAKLFYAKKSDDRPVSKRIEDLFTSFATRRSILLGILIFLDEPKRSDLLDEKVTGLQENNVSVYSGYNYSQLLSEVGAIKKVNEDGSDFDEEAEQLPDIVEIDGAKFYKPTDGKQVFWLTTDEGHAYLETDDPYTRLVELIAGEPQYQTIYKRLLEFCDNEVGRTSEELVKLIDDDPLVQKPRKYFSYFAKKLEDCSALSWTKKWQTSELGKKGLELLFSENNEAEFVAGTDGSTGGE
jgi:hypothetical protein